MIRKPALFDAFEKSLAHVESLSVGSPLTNWESKLSDYLTDRAIRHLLDALERPLADLIAKPRLRRFSNQFVAVMVRKVERSHLQADTAAKRITFDVALLAYLFHTVAEGTTLHRPDKVLTLFAKGLWRKATGKRGFVAVQIREQLDRYALPWINATVGAFVHAAVSRDYLTAQQGANLLRHYWARSVIAARNVTPKGRHPLAPHTIDQCLQKPRATGASDYFDEAYRRDIFDATMWDVAATLREYNEEPWALSGYDPSTD